MVDPPAVDPPAQADEVMAPADGASASSSVAAMDVDGAAGETQQAPAAKEEEGQKTEGQPAPAPLAPPAAPMEQQNEGAGLAVDGGLAEVDAALCGSASVHGNFSCSLSRTDPATSVDDFFILQLLAAGASGGFLILSRWGSAGTAGQSALSERFADADAAITEFDKMYTEKTGRAWANQAVGAAPEVGKYSHHAAAVQGQAQTQAHEQTPQVQEKPDVVQQQQQQPMLQQQQQPPPQQQQPPQQLLQPQPQEQAEQVQQQQQEQEQQQKELKVEDALLYLDQVRAPCAQSLLRLLVVSAHCCTLV